MKLPCVFFLLAVALAMNACEKHPASELPPELREGAEKKADTAEK